MSKQKLPSTALIPSMAAALTQNMREDAAVFLPSVASLLPSIDLESGSPSWRWRVSDLSTFDTKPQPTSETSSVAYIAQPVTTFLGTQEKKWQSVVPREKSLDERLFEALADVKVLTSKIAMHLDREWRDLLFAQLDKMHSPAEWDDEDELLKTESFGTFLKFWFLLKPQKNPGFGISVRGNLLASWSSEGRNLTLEFFSNNAVSWLLSLPSGEIRERACGHTSIDKLLSRLSPYEPQRWFVNDQGSKHPG